MKKSKRWIALTAALALSGLLLVGGAAAASGDANDPLVSLSYLEKVVIPDVIRRVEEKLGLRQQELQNNLSDQVDAYRQEMENAMGASGTGSSFVLVSMKQGQTFSPNTGCELMLRDGSVTVKSPTSTALLDMTDGNTVKNGASLVKNHLYMAADSGRSMTASGSVTLLVRGGYTLK